MFLPNVSLQGIVGKRHKYLGYQGPFSDHRLDSPSLCAEKPRYCEYGVYDTIGTVEKYKRCCMEEQTPNSDLPPEPSELLPLSMTGCTNPYAC